LVARPVGDRPTKSISTAADVCREATLGGGRRSIDPPEMKAIPSKIGFGATRRSARGLGERARHLPRRPKSGSGSTENRPACNCDAPFLRTERFLCRDARVRALICTMRLAAARPRKPTLFSTVISSISRLIALLDSVHLRDLRTNERVRRSLSIANPTARVQLQRGATFDISGKARGSAHRTRALAAPPLPTSR
jgi:hypothetical protein